MRRLLIVAAVIAVLAALSAIVLRQTFGGERVRAAVEARLSAMFGQPVSVGRLGLRIFPRVSLAGADVRLGQPDVRAPALGIERVRILPRLRSLLGGEVIIEEVALDGFVVSVLRDARGGWHLPSVVPAPTAGASAGPTIERVTVTNGRVRVFDEAAGGTITETGSIDHLGSQVTVAPDGLRLAPISARIGAATVTGDARTDAAAVRLAFAADAIADRDLPAFLRLIGSDRPAFLRLAEAASASVAIRVDRASARLTGTGMVRAPQVVVDPLRLQRLEAPFAIKGTALVFNPATFAMYGGTHRGTITVDLAERPPLWSSDSRVNSIAVGEFLRALTGRDQRLDGTASIDATLRGRVGEPLGRTLRGRARVIVIQGVIRNFPLLAAVNRALRLAEQENNDTRFERLAATLDIAGGEATTDDLTLEAGQVRVEAAGRIGADRSLALRGHAVVSRERVAAAVASVPEIARLRNSRGEIDVPLTISGTLDAPSFGIDVKTAIGQGLMDELRRRVRRWIR